MIIALEWSDDAFLAGQSLVTVQVDLDGELCRLPRAVRHREDSSTVEFDYDGA